jgi:[acyl-carrier-protein] S-malonyltransferase
VTIVFPGQGTQYVGMAKNFSDSPLFEKAERATGLNLKSLMLEGPTEELKKTENTQPAIVAHSLMLFELLQKIIQRKNWKIQQVLGHSVGEYSALCAAGVLSFDDAVKAVHYRGKFMQEAAPAGKGTMYAILKQPEDLIRTACAEVSSAAEKVSPANFNEPSQIVISGDKPACEKAIKWLEEKTGSRVKAIELQVSAPFHCELMKPAELRLKSVLEQCSFKPLNIPYIANIDAKIYDSDTSLPTIMDNLLKQVCGSVLWTQSVQKISNDNLIIECGPGKVLSGLIKKINPQLNIISLDSETGLAELEAL